LTECLSTKMILPDLSSVVVEPLVVQLPVGFEKDGDWQVKMSFYRRNYDCSS